MSQSDPEFRPAPRRAVILIIMDGVGLNPSRINNAVAIAKTPNLDRLYSSNPVTVLEASGAAVGLPSGQMGNSEVGHLTLGCGTVLRQDMAHATLVIRNGLVNLPNRIAGELAVEIDIDEVASVLKREMTRLLEDMRDEISKSPALQVEK